MLARQNVDLGRGLTLIPSCLSNMPPYMICFYIILDGVRKYVIFSDPDSFGMRIITKESIIW